MPGAGTVRAGMDGGAMKGGAPRVVWMTLGADPQQLSAHSAAERLCQLDRAPHLVWNPLTGQSVQLVPVVWAACALGTVVGADQAGSASPADLFTTGPLAVPAADDTAEIHNEGRLCVQIAVLGFGWAPFTSGPMTGLGPILEWLDSWHVQRRWPAGRPAPFAHAHTATRSRRLWAYGGYYGASQVPGRKAAGPGAIDVDRLISLPVKRGADVPLQRGAAQRPVAAPVSAMSGLRDEHESAEELARAV